MPNRILREGALRSDPLAAVDELSEVLFYRLLLLADDFGRFDGRVSVIRALGFTLRQQIKDKELSRRLDCLAKVGLIVRYEVAGKPFLFIPKFDQRTRAKVSKYPEPPPDVSQRSVTSQASAHGDGDGDVYGGDVYGPDGPLSVKPNGHDVFKEAEGVLSYLNTTAERAFEFRTPRGGLTPNAMVIIARLKEGYTPEQLREVVLAKADKWKGDEKMHEYLRPATLFAKQKFAQYVGELNG